MGAKNFPVSFTQNYLPNSCEELKEILNEKIVWTKYMHKTKIKKDQVQFNKQDEVNWTELRIG